MRKHRGNAKLVARQAIEVCRLWVTGNYTQPELAHMYGVTPAQIGKITRGEAWADVTGMNQDIADEAAPPAIIQKYDVPPDIQKAADDSAALLTKILTNQAAEAKAAPHSISSIIMRCNCGAASRPFSTFPWRDTETGITHHRDKPCTEEPT